MGFSVSAGTAIILIAAFASVGMLYTTAYNGFEDVQTAQEIDHEADVDTLNSEIAITEITHNSSANPHYVNVSATNNGSVTLAVDETDFLLNGTYWSPTRDDVTYTIVSDGTQLSTGPDGTNLWEPHETLQITLRENVTDPLTVKLVAETGVSATEVGP